MLNPVYKNGRVKRSACRAAGRLGQVEAVPLLIACLQDEEEIVAESAIRALGELGDKRAAVPLARLFDRQFKSWARTRIPGALAAALARITGQALEGRRAWQDATGVTDSNDE